MGDFQSFWRILEFLRYTILKYYLTKTYIYVYILSRIFLQFSPKVALYRSEDSVNQFSLLKTNAFNICLKTCILQYFALRVLKHTSGLGEIKSKKSLHRLNSIIFTFFSENSEKFCLSVCFSSVYLSDILFKMESYSLVWRARRWGERTPDEMKMLRFWFLKNGW